MRSGRRRFSPPTARDNVPTKVHGALRAVICVLMGMAPFFSAAQAQGLPLWELGGGAAVLRVPDYRGSEEVRNYLLPVPWVVYRGEILRADRDGVRAQLFNSERFDLNLSINGSVPVDSDRNRARQGMEDLRPVFEIGPVANIHLWGAADRRAALDLRMPVRAAFTFRDGLSSVGYIAAPQLTLDLRWPSATAPNRWNLGLLVEVPFADRRLNGYFYSVSAADATATRPAYRAPSGYSGWQALAALSRRVDRWWFGGFIKYDDLSNSVFADSPLVTQKRQVSGGFAVVYVFARSSTLVPPRD